MVPPPSEQPWTQIWIHQLVRVTQYQTIQDLPTSASLTTNAACLPTIQSWVREADLGSGSDVKRLLYMPDTYFVKVHFLCFSYFSVRSGQWSGSRDRRASKRMTSSSLSHDHKSMACCP